MTRMTAVKKAYLRQENKKYGNKLERIPIPDDVEFKVMPIEIWRCAQYLVQVYKEDDHERISVNRAAVHGRRNGYSNEHNWDDKIPWDHLQAIKRQIGRGDKLAVEIYPPDRDVVNVAAMRHLWIYDDVQDLGFRRKRHITPGG